MPEEDHKMEYKKPHYTPEFKAEAISLVRDGSKPIAVVAKDIGVSASALRKWVKQADIDEGKGPKDALTTSEREELTRLRREYRQVKMERDFLKKATAFFARENS
jgi:transposase